MARPTPSREPSGGAVRALVALSLALAACGPGPTRSGDLAASTEPEAAPGVLDADSPAVGSSLRISWTVTNASGGDLVVFDDRRPDEPDGSERYGAFVTAGHEDATVEVSRRLFPVPDDLEGVQAYGVAA